MNKEKLYYQLFLKNTNSLYYGSGDIESVLYVYSHFTFRKDLEFRVVKEYNSKSIWY
jgi:hypothetical protein